MIKAFIVEYPSEMDCDTVGSVDGLSTCGRVKFYGAGLGATMTAVFSVVVLPSDSAHEVNRKISEAVIVAAVGAGYTLDEKDILSTELVVRL